MRRTVFIIIMTFFYLLGMPLLLAAHIIGHFNRDLKLKIAYWYNRLTGLLVLGVGGAKVIASGLENLETDQNVVYVGNHRSMLDIPLLMKYVKRPIVFIGKENVLKWPVISWWMRAGEALFIDRARPRQGLEVILTGIKRLKAGESIAIFPEGTRSKTEEIGVFKQGSLKLSTKSGVAILPIAIKGTDDVFEKNGFNLKSHVVHFQVGKIIPAETLQQFPMDNGTAYVRSIIEEMYKGFSAQPEEKELTNENE